MLRKTSAILSLALGSLAAQTHAGNESRAEAFAFDRDQIEVIADFSESAIYWCGAATYVFANAPDASGQRIFVWQGPSDSRARPGQKSVKFALRPPPGIGAVSSLSTDVGIIGNSMSAAQALQTCNERSASG